MLNVVHPVTGTIVDAKGSANGYSNIATAGTRSELATLSPGNPHRAPLQPRLLNLSDATLLARAGRQ